MRIAHLTATFPPVSGRGRQHGFRFAREQAARGEQVEVFTAPAAGEAPDPGAAIVHRIKPVFAIGNAPLIPSLARVEGFDVVHLHYPFIFGSELTLLGRLRRAAALPGPARPLQEPTRRRRRSRGPVRDLRAHRRTAPDRRGRPRLRALHRPRAVGLLPAARGRRGSREADRDAERRRRGAVLAGRGRERAAGAARDPRRRHRRRLRRDARPRPPLQAPRRRDRRPRPARRRARPPARRRRRRAARRLSRGRRRRGRRRARPLPRRGPARRAARGAARDRPLPAHHRAARVVRDRPDRGDGLRAAGDRDRLPGRARRGRRGCDRAAHPPGRSGAVARAIGELVDGGPGGPGGTWRTRTRKAVVEWSWPQLVDRMDAAYAEAIEARRRRMGG